MTLEDMADAHRVSVTEGCQEAAMVERTLNDDELENRVPARSSMRMMSLPAGIVTDSLPFIEG